VRLFKKLTLTLIFVSNLVQLSAMDPSNEKLLAEQVEEMVIQEAINNKLIAAVITNDLEKARAALLEGANPDIPFNNTSMTRFGHVTIQGATTLSHAALHGNTDMVDLLINKGAQFSQPIKIDHNKTNTPLGLAIFYNRPETVKLLIEATANLSTTINKGLTVLMVAVIINHDANTESTIRTLIRAGADYTLTDKDGQTALAHAGGRFLDLDPDFPAPTYWILKQAIQEHERLMQTRRQRIKAGLVPKPSLQQSFDYLVDKPLSITPLCNLCIEYADHDRPYTPAEAAQRAAAATIRQEWIKRKRMEMAARRRAEKGIAAQATQ
jgi:hypothetical protein